MGSVFAAVAALVAACTSLATLVVTTLVIGRREQNRWAREALTDAFVAFLDASWRGSDVFAAQSRPVDAGETSQQAYTDMRTQLTRLRLLGSDGVRATGLDLLRAQRSLNDAPDADIPAAMARVSAGRVSMMEIAKREMGLG